MVAVEEVDAPAPSLLVRDVILQAVTDGISLADVDRLFRSVAHKNVDTGLVKARSLHQQVEEPPVEDDAVARPVRLVEVANPLRIACGCEERD